MRPRKQQLDAPTGQANAELAGALVTPCAPATKPDETARAGPSAAPPAWQARWLARSKVNNDDLEIKGAHRRPRAPLRANLNASASPQGLLPVDPASVRPENGAGPRGRAERKAEEGKPQRSASNVSISRLTAHVSASPPRAQRPHPPTQAASEAGGPMAWPRACRCANSEGACLPDQS